MDRTVSLAQRFEGYHFELHTALSAAECQRRLRADFLDTKGRWQHARSDNQFVGRPWLDGFLVVTSRLIGRHDVPLNFLVRFRTTSSGTTIACTHSRFLQPSSQIATVACLAFGAVIIPLGLVQSFFDRSALLLAVAGMIFVVAGFAQYNAPFTEGARRERSQFTRFLTRLLDAQEQSPVGNGGVALSRRRPETGDRPARSGVKIVRGP